jgi:hypothetical protein
LTESAQLCPRGSFGEGSAELRLAILDRLEGEYERARKRLLAVSRSFDEAGVSSTIWPGYWASTVRLEHANQARAAGRFDEARARITDVLGLWQRFLHF